MQILAARPSPIPLVGDPCGAGAGFPAQFIPMSATAREQSPAAAAAARRRRVMIVAGEASGDLHGADLAAQILARDPGAICSASPASGCARPACARSPAPRTSPASALPNWPRPSGTPCGVLRELKSMLRSDRPDLVILIDFAEFNLSLARRRQARRRPGALLHHAAGLGLAARPRGSHHRTHRSARRGAAVRGRNLRGRRPAGHLRRPSAARPRRSRPGSRRHAQTSRPARPRAAAHAAPGQPARRGSLSAAPDGRSGARARGRPRPHRR